MTPNELYKRTPESIDNDINIFSGCYYNFLPEIEELENCWFDDKEICQNRIQINYYKDFDFDGRRFWRLCAIKFDDEFVMIIQNAGREGDDHTGRFITNKYRYYEMVHYVKRLMPAGEDVSEEDIVDANKDIKTLDKFYGNELDGYFERYGYER